MYWYIRQASRQLAFFGLEQQTSHGYNYIKVWKRPIQGWSIQFFELLHRMEQGFADTTTSRQATEE